MKRSIIFSRILKNACPKCKYRKIINKKGELIEKCPSCNLLLKREDGFMLGALPINYALVFFFWVLPVIILWALELIEENTLWILLAAGVLVIPFLLVRFSRILWLATYFSILPYTLEEKE